MPELGEWDSVPRRYAEITTASGRALAAALGRHVTRLLQPLLRLRGAAPHLWRVPLPRPSAVQVAQEPAARGRLHRPEGRGLLPEAAPADAPPGLPHGAPPSPPLSPPPPLPLPLPPRARPVNPLNPARAPTLSCAPPPRQALNEERLNRIEINQKMGKAPPKKGEGKRSKKKK